MTKIILVMLMLFGSVLSLNAQCDPGQNIIQDNLNTNLLIGSNIIGQSFVPDCTGFVESISIYNTNPTVAGTATLTVYEGTSGVNLIGSVDFDRFIDDTGYTTIAFSSPISVTAAATYTFLIDLGTSQGDFGGSNVDSYSEGSTWRYQPGAFTPGFGANVDFTFSINFVDELSRCGPGQNIIQDIIETPLISGGRVDGQSFIPTCNGYIETISLFTNDVTTAGVATLTIYEGTSGANPLGSVTFNRAVGDYGPISIPLPSPIAVTNALTYSFMIDKGTSVGDFIGDNTNSYPDGRTWSYQLGDFNTAFSQDVDYTFSINFVDEISRCGPGQNIIQDVIETPLISGGRVDGQSFIPTCNGDIETISLFTNDVTTAGVATLTIYEGTSGANPLGSVTFNRAVGDYGPISIPLSSPISVTNALTYSFMIDKGTSVGNFIGDNTNSYPDGRTWRYQLGDFNTAFSQDVDYTFSINFVDEIDPVAVCQNYITQLDAMGNATITAVNLDGGSSDDSGTVTLSLDNDTFDCTDLGTNSVILTATDAAGNTDSCVATVTVQDTVAPTVICQDITVQLDADGNVTITAAQIDNGSNDACGVLSLDLDTTTFDCSTIGANTVTLTATDVNDNSSSCTAIVTVQDTVAPTVICQDITVQLDADGNATITAAQIDNGSNDACGVLSLDLDTTTFDCSAIGSNTVTLTATDVNDNSSSCTAIVTIQDTVAPTVICQDITVQLDADGNATITAAQIDNGSNDACGVLSLDLDSTTFDCSAIGVNTVTLTATDVNDNSSSCTAIVTVQDTVAPTVICQDITVQLDADGNTTITAAQIDNGSNDACGVLSLDLDTSTFDCSTIGANTVTLTATDVNDNSSSCTAIVTVQDTVAPTVICQDITVQLDADGNATITAAQIDNGSNDACGILSLDLDTTTFDCSAIGVNTVTLTATDVNDNSSSCTAIVTVQDTVAPTVICQDITVQLDATGSASITVGDIDGGAIDNCDVASSSLDITDFTCGNVGSNSVTLTVTDINGNMATCVATVTVEDVIAPTIACSANLNANTDLGECSAVVVFPDAIALDNCNVASITQTAGLVSGSQFPIGVSTVEYTAVDDSGNTAVCSFIITVEDNEVPVIECQDITIQLDEFGGATITAVDVTGISSDNCGVASNSIDIDTFNCSNVGANDVELTVTDVNGNTSTCIAIVTVEDVTAPEIVCTDITIQLDATGTVIIAGIDIVATSNDACGIDTYELDIDTFDCSNIGENTVTLTVTDINGNDITCTSIVTVEDVTAPELICMDITVELDENGMAEITAEDVIASNVDNCSIMTSAVDITMFDCSDIGSPIMVQVFTEDSNGNLSSCFATVTVIDVLAPVVICPTDQTVDPGVGNLFYEVPDYFASAEAMASDNCTDPLTILSQDPVAGTLLSDGVYNITMTAEDAYGNIGSCEFELTVESILGVDDSNLELATLVMYPNPAKDVVHISNPNGIELSEAIIYDIAGRIVSTQQLQDTGIHTSFNISELSSATYLMIIRGPNGQITKSLLKE